MFNTFNMGVGMTVVVSREEADKALATLRPRAATPMLSARSSPARSGWSLC